MPDVIDQDATEETGDLFFKENLRNYVELREIFKRVKRGHRNLNKNSALHLCRRFTQCWLADIG